MGVARRPHARQLRRPPDRGSRPPRALLPPRRVHLSLARAQLRRARTAAHPRRSGAFPRAARAAHHGPGLALDERPGDGVSRDTVTPRRLHLALRDSAVSALSEARTAAMGRA